MLKDSQLAKDVVVARRIFNQLNESLSRLEGLIEKDDRNGAIAETFEYEKFAERLCNNARLMPISTGMPKALKVVENTIIEENNCEICFTKQGWFKAIIPSILTRKEKGDPSWIRATFSSSMKRYFSDNDVKRITEKSIIIFRHCYSKDRKEREYRDHDNIEINAIVDMVALYVLVDDSPMKLKHFYCSSKEDIDKTEIFLVPEVDFIEWLNLYEIVGVR